MSHGARKRIRLLGLAGAVAMLLAGAALALAYAEEPLHFRDPYSGQTTEEEISTIHDDLTYVLALAAGFSISDSIRLQIANQLVDSEQIGPGNGVWYSNCQGTFAPTPDPGLVCPKPRPGADYLQVAWPLWDRMQDPASCTTSRYGPYMPFFHFPHDNAAELGVLHDWGWGARQTLEGYEAYAWGAASVLQATCRYTRTATISTTIPGGSLEAFSIYLHSMADFYSHRECIAEMDAQGMPWATHSLYGISACNYNPANPKNDDAHGREFGTDYLTDSQRTDQAIRAVYAELLLRAERREGRYRPLTLETHLTNLEDSPTLDEALYTFVHAWTFDQPAERRAWADQMAAAVLAQRQARGRVFLPGILQ